MITSCFHKFLVRCIRYCSIHYRIRCPAIGWSDITDTDGLDHLASVFSCYISFVWHVVELVENKQEVFHSVIFL